MEYILIPSKSKRETAFLLSLLKKMQKEATTLTTNEMEEVAFLRALKEAEQTPKGSLAKVKAHLAKITKG